MFYVHQFGLSASDIATEMGFLQIVSIIKDYMIRHEYQREHANLQQKNSLSVKTKDKDDKAVKKCCVLV